MIGLTPAAIAGLVEVERPEHRAVVGDRRAPASRLGRLAEQRRRSSPPRPAARTPSAHGGGRSSLTAERTPPPPPPRRRSTALPARPVDVGENLWNYLHACDSRGSKDRLLRPSKQPTCSRERVERAPSRGAGQGDRMRLSYSSINTYETCPAKFKFQYEDRVPQARSAALSFGDSLHRALYLFHNRPVPVPPSRRRAPRHARGVLGLRGVRRRGRGADLPRPRPAGPVAVPPRERRRVPDPGRPRVPLHDRGRGRRALRRDRPHGPDPRRRLRDHRLQDQPAAAAAVAHRPGPPALDLPPGRPRDLGHRTRTPHALLPAPRPADDDGPNARRRRRAPSSDRRRGRADRGREVRAAAEPALRLVRLPGPVPAVPSPLREGAGRPHPAHDRDGGRVDQAQARGPRGVPSVRRARAADQRVRRRARVPAAVRLGRRRDRPPRRST